MYGYRPYNDRIRPVESWPVTYVNLLGEGYHNYHHTFPQDYKASEYGYFFQCNLTALFIDTMALIGQVYDRKSASPCLVEACKQKVINSKKV
jgi:acyl-coA delta-9 desaturase